MSTNPSDESKIPQGPQADDALLGAHEKLLDRQPDERAHYRLLPLVMLFAFSGLIFFAGTYLNRYSGHFAPSIFNENALPSTGEAVAVKEDPGVVGKRLFNSSGACYTCHMPNGQGQPGAYPPLAGSEWVNGGEDRLIHIVIYGLNGPVHVAGKSFNAAAMPTFGQVTHSSFNWSDERIANVLTYIRSDWGNKGAAITPEQVAAVRTKEGSRAPMTEEQLLQIK